ncbi:MAG: AmmeMemoRadiSam system protein A [Candidatus Lambdaproteobacteria bacterium]|nr:AmmeMemoRadiSam system protein A [Candidatus Lambdaproteobacteria bacterium]
MYKDLLPLARETIRAHLAGHGLEPLPPRYPAQACFVSLKIGQRLRGCIGTIQPAKEHLEWEVQSNAIAAANRDPRFQPVTPDELARIGISVDVLSPVEPVTHLAELDPLRYGLIVRAGRRCGVLLPDIAGVRGAAHQLEICLEKGQIGPRETYTMARFTVSRVQEP